MPLHLLGQLGRVRHQVHRQGHRVEEELFLELAKPLEEPLQAFPLQEVGRPKLLDGLQLDPPEADRHPPSPQLEEPRLGLGKRKVERPDVLHKAMP